MSFKVDGIDHYHGGKGGSGTYQTIINFIRPHDFLMIPFVGHCAVTRWIKGCKATIGFDTDINVVTSWKKMNLSRIKVNNGCGIKFLEDLAILNHSPFLTDERVVIYVDPPYPLSSRKSQIPVYSNELTDQDHIRILESLKLINSKFGDKIDILISTYKNKIYSELLEGWNLYKFKSTTRRGTAIEYLYMNFTNEEGVLHDYAFIGKDYRQRERIKKKINRWVNRLNSLPPFERNAILYAMDHNTKNNDAARFQKVLAAGLDKNDGTAVDSITGSGVCQACGKESSIVRGLVICFECYEEETLYDLIWN